MFRDYRRGKKIEAVHGQKRYSISIRGLEQITPLNDLFENSKLLILKCEMQKEGVLIPREEAGVA